MSPVRHRPNKPEIPSETKLWRYFDLNGALNLLSTNQLKFFKNDAFSGEVYLFQLAAAQFSKRFWKEQSPEAFYLSKKDVNDIRIIRYI